MNKKFQIFIRELNSACNYYSCRHCFLFNMNAANAHTIVQLYKSM